MLHILFGWKTLFTPNPGQSCMLVLREATLDGTDSSMQNKRGKLIHPGKWYNPHISLLPLTPRIFMLWHLIGRKDSSGAHNTSLLPKSAVPVPWEFVWRADSIASTQADFIIVSELRLWFRVYSTFQDTGPLELRISDYEPETTGQNMIFRNTSQGKRWGAEAGPVLLPNTSSFLWWECFSPQHPFSLRE